MNIVGGTVANRREGKVYNTCYIFDRTGTEVASYDKAHLFTPSGESADFAAGDNAVTFRLDGVLCGVAVCYDMRFPEFIRKLALENISVLFLPAAWPASRLSHWQILTSRTSSMSSRPTRPAPTSRATTSPATQPSSIPGARPLLRQTKARPS